MLALVMNTALALAAAAPLPPPVSMPPEPPAPAQVMAVPEELRNRFQRQVMDRAYPAEKRVQRLVDFMFQTDGLDMQYQYDATYTVAQAYATRRANCLTFTLLAVALAREAGLEAYGQQIEETLAWRQEEDTIYRTNHINAGIRVHQRRLTIDVAWDLVIARDPPEPISDARLLAHYYNNRAAELMAQHRLEEAQAFADISLGLDPGYPTSWSNAGVIAVRRGDTATAVHDYQRALALSPRHPGALFNLASYYQRSGQDALAAPLRKRLMTLQANDPFHQFLLAAEYERDGNYKRALRHYKRAIRLYDGEHRFHFGLARAYFHLGDNHRAGKALTRAHELSEGVTRQRYQAKLDTLRRAMP